MTPVRLAFGAVAVLALAACSKSNTAPTPEHLLSRHNSNPLPFKGKTPQRAERMHHTGDRVASEAPLGRATALATQEASPLPTLDSTRLLARAAFDVAVGEQAMPSWRGGPAGS